jgi:hypothetical protein
MRGNRRELGRLAGVRVSSGSANGRSLLDGWHGGGAAGVADGPRRADVPEVAAGKSSCLAIEALAVARGRHQLRRWHLDGDRAIQPHVLRLL